MGFCGDDCKPKRRLFPGGDCNEGCGDERKLWDSIASEPARLAGEPIQFYSIRRAKNRDPLYKEPSAEGKEWSFNGPFEVYATIDFPQADNITQEARDDGEHSEADAIAWVARKEFEDREAPYPKRGDVVEFWAVLPWGYEKENTQWDVVKASRDGNMFTTAAYVMYKIDLKQRSKFVAFRKTEHSRI
jgi:hypothetical protein